MEKTEWLVIGRGKAGWHASAKNCSSSGGTLMPIKYERGSRTGYISEASEGCRVYDAEKADYDSFCSLIIGGPMLKPELGDEECDSFSKADIEAAKRMLPGMSGGFETVLGRAIDEADQPKAWRKYGSLDRVGWGIYRRLLEAVGGVRFGTVRNGEVVWEDSK